MKCPQIPVVELPGCAELETESAHPAQGDPDDSPRTHVLRRLAFLPPRDLVHSYHLLEPATNRFSGVTGHDNPGTDFSEANEHEGKESTRDLEAKEADDLEPGFAESVDGESEQRRKNAWNNTRANPWEDTGDRVWNDDTTRPGLEEEITGIMLVEDEEEEVEDLLEKVVHRLWNESDSDVLVLEAHQMVPVDEDDEGLPDHSEEPSITPPPAQPREQRTLFSRLARKLGSLHLAIPGAVLTLLAPGTTLHVI